MAGTTHVVEDKRLIDEIKEDAAKAAAELVKEGKLHR